MHLLPPQLFPSFLMQPRSHGPAPALLTWIAFVSFGPLPTAGQIKHSTTFSKISVSSWVENPSNRAPLFNPHLLSLNQTSASTPQTQPSPSRLHLENLGGFVFGLLCFSGASGPVAISSLCKRILHLASGTPRPLFSLYFIVVPPERLHI